MVWVWVKFPWLGGLFWHLLFWVFGFVFCLFRVEFLVLYFGLVLGWFLLFYYVRLGLRCLVGIRQGIVF